MKREIRPLISFQQYNSQNTIKGSFSVWRYYFDDSDFYDALFDGLFYHLTQRRKQANEYFILTQKNALRSATWTNTPI